MAIARYAVSAYKSPGHLPFFGEHANLTPPQLLNTTKESIIADFLQGFKQIQIESDPRIKKMDRRQLQKLLSEWNSVKPDTLGQKLSEEIAAEINDKSLVGNVVADFNTLVADTDAAAKNAVEIAQGSLDIIKNVLSNYISILQTIEEPILLAKVVELYQLAGGSIKDPILSKYNGTKISASEIKELNNKVSTSLGTLESIIQQLGNVDKNDGSIKSIEELMHSARGCFSEIGSEGIHEPLVAHSINIVGQAIQEKCITPTENAFKESGGKILNSYSNNTSNTGERDTKMNGNQLKPDIEIYWNPNGITYHIPASLKARYSSKNYNLNKKNIKGNITPQPILLGELLAMSVRSDRGITGYEHGWGAILEATEGKGTRRFSDEHYSPLIASWEQFKENAKFIALFRGLIGTGLKDDFSALLIVNDQIFSIYDILSNVNNNKIIKWSSQTPLPDYLDIARDVSFKYGPNNWPTKDQRIKEESKAIAQWYKKKYQIEIQLTFLSQAIAK